MVIPLKEKNNMGGSSGGGGGKGGLGAGGGGGKGGLGGKIGGGGGGIGSAAGWRPAAPPPAPPKIAPTMGGGTPGGGGKGAMGQSPVTGMARPGGGAMGGMQKPMMPTGLTPGAGIAPKMGGVGTSPTMGGGIAPPIGGPTTNMPGAAPIAPTAGPQATAGPAGSPTQRNPMATAETLMKSPNVQNLQKNQYFQKLYENVPGPVQMNLLKSAQLTGGSAIKAADAATIAPVVAPQSPIAPSRAASVPQINSMAARGPMMGGPQVTPGMMRQQPQLAPLGGQIQPGSMAPTAMGARPPMMGNQPVSPIGGPVQPMNQLAMNGSRTGMPTSPFRPPSAQGLVGPSNQYGSGFQSAHPMLSPSGGVFNQWGAGLTPRPTQGPMMPSNAPAVAPTTPGVPAPVYPPLNNIMQNSPPTPSPISAAPASGERPLGSLSSKYESGAGGASTVAYDTEGGWSYGTYQLAAKPGTLNSFLKKSGYGDEFAGMKVGSPQFNQQWKSLAKSDPQFAAAQHNYIQKTHYEPVKSYANKLGVPDNPAVNDVLWSLGVQHGGANKIVQKAYNQVKDNYTPENFINAVYDVRSNYVAGNPYVKSLRNRYKTEKQDALKMLGN